MPESEWMFNIDAESLEEVFSIFLAAKLEKGCGREVRSIYNAARH